MNLKALQDEEQILLKEWRAGLKKLQNLKRGIWMVRYRIKEESN